MPQNQINIAILDDHQIIIDGLKLLLETDNSISVVLEATSGSVFIKKITEISAEVHIVLLDLMMPEISGFEMAELLKKDFPAIKAVNNGEEYFCHEAEQEISNYEKISKELEQITLTKREVEIVRLIDKGLTNREIANKLFISEQTVTTHRKSILRKAGAHNVSSLLNFARKSRII